MTLPGGGHLSDDLSATRCRAKELTLLQRCSLIVFGTAGSDPRIYVKEIAPSPAETATNGFIKSQSSTFNAQLQPVFLPADRVSDGANPVRRSQNVQADRCDGQLAPVAKYNAPALPANGCGTGPFIYDYLPLKKAECFVRHDH
jgi:hypothetical protein